MFDVFYTGAESDVAEQFPFARQIASGDRIRTRTKMYWVVDSDTDIRDYTVFDYRPDEHEQQYEHVWSGGLRLLPKDRPCGIKKHTEQVATRKIDILHTSDPGDYFERNPDRTRVWCIDPDYQLPDNIDWIPDEFEPTLIHNFHLGDQLRDKYQYDQGGISLYPNTWRDNVTMKFWGNLPEHTAKQTSQQACPKQIKDHEESSWYWEVDSDVDVLDSFDFEYVPGPQDQGKKHVWQILNPITKLPYDYGGVSLCPRGKDNPEVVNVMKPASVHKQFPVYYLNGKSKDLIAQLEKFDQDAENTMYWVVDPFHEVLEDFACDWYPTHWDSMMVHVFMREHDGKHTGMRLFPKGTFVKGQHDMLIEDVYANRFSQFKYIHQAVTRAKTWPVDRFQDQTLEELENILRKHQDTEFVFTLDHDVKMHPEFHEQMYTPEPEFADRIHMWQRTNPHTSQVHSYGGLRLWPTNTDISKLTTSAIQNNKFRNRRYVREAGAVYHAYDVVFISYHDHHAQARYDSLASKVSVENLHWVKDVDGIFEAHQQAARQASSKMFWVVDADADVIDEFDFSYMPETYDQDVVHVWHSENPLTGEVYGYGGVKLFNREQVLNATSWGLDFTTGLSTRFKVIPELSCVSRFNTDAYSTWRSAFRECVKLSVSTDPDAPERLSSWQNPVHDADYRAQCVAGSQAGIAYAQAHEQDLAALDKINDYAFLQEMYRVHN